MPKPEPQTTPAADFFYSGTEERGLRIDTHGTAIGVTVWDKAANECGSVLVDGAEGRRLSEWLAEFYKRNSANPEP